MRDGEVGRLRIGIDLGGTKIEGVALDTDGTVRARERIAAPRNDYAATITAIRDLVRLLRERGGAGQDPSTATIGMGMPGSLSPRTGLMQNANSVWLNGKPFDRDLVAAIGQPIRLANDANCFALSEATDGAAAGAARVFGIILGTGCGGGIVLDGRLSEGGQGISGEWGHNPLPWMSRDEHPGPQCWCGRYGCMETWVSGPGLEGDHLRVTGNALNGPQIVERAAAGDRQAQATLDRHADRLARGLAHVVNIIDPEVIVIGGGLSELTHLYEVLPRLMAHHVFCDAPSIRVVPPRWGDASGVRGAAWLWDDDGPWNLSATAARGTCPDR